MSVSQPPEYNSVRSAGLLGARNRYELDPGNGERAYAPGFTRNG